jgi:hypothetical protein
MPAGYKNPLAHRCRANENSAIGGQRWPMHHGTTVKTRPMPGWLVGVWVSVCANGFRPNQVDPNGAVGADRNAWLSTAFL